MILGLNKLARGFEFKVNDACYSILRSSFVVLGINNVKIDTEIFPIAQIQSGIDIKGHQK